MLTQFLIMFKMGNIKTRPYYLPMTYQVTWMIRRRDLRTGYSYVPIIESCVFIISSRYNFISS